MEKEKERPNDDEFVSDLAQWLSNDEVVDRRRRRAGVSFEMLVIVIGLSIGLVAAGVTMFVQTFPAVPVVSLTSNCDTLEATPNVDPILVGTSGFITWDCGTAAAFLAPEGSSGIPNSDLAGTGYTTLFIYPAGSAVDPLGTCSSINGARQLESGTEETFASEGSFNYCSDFQSAPSGEFAEFTISWST